MQHQGIHGLRWLVNELDRLDGLVDEPTARRLLAEARLSRSEVASYIEEGKGSYSRRSVVRRESYELLVLTWTPSQGSVAHDHSGSLCGLKVVEGRLIEQQFEQGPDGQVRETGISRLEAGEVIVDSGAIIHSLRNDARSREVLVTVHLYSPPLPEIRRYAIDDQPPKAVFLRKRRENARVVAIIGGGFTGTMALANLLRFGDSIKTPLHLVMIDRQPALGEGVAYRTNDTRHLLNVPASRMSAWPDRPDDFLAFARGKDPSVGPNDFLPRKSYGEYIRRTLSELADSADDRISVEVVRDEVSQLVPTEASGWSIETGGGRSIHADLAVLTVGHRPPNDVFSERWSGPRHRFIADPWASLVLSQISPDEPVLLLGSGLTAVDAILTLNRQDRTAPLFVVSRRGVMPLPHAREPRHAADVSELLASWLDPSRQLTVRRLVSTLRRHVATAAEAGVDWRSVIDGIRPAIQKLWERLSVGERRRFLTHVRPFWEVHRHRMAPDIAETIEHLRQNGTVRFAAGSFISASADAGGIDVTISQRHGSQHRTERVAWVINCTGPGVHNRHSTHPFLRPLLGDGTLCEDALSLGLRTDPAGYAIDASGRTLNTLLVGGTLRKSTLWESTAVPELRTQAQTIARNVLAAVSGWTGNLRRPQPLDGPGHVPGHGKRDRSGSVPTLIG